MPRYRTSLDPPITVAHARPRRMPPRPVRVVEAVPPRPVMPHPRVMPLRAAGGSGRVTRVPNPFTRAGLIVRFSLEPAYCLPCEAETPVLDPMDLALAPPRTGEAGRCARCDRPVVRFGVQHAMGGT